MSAATLPRAPRAPWHASPVALRHGVPAALFSLKCFLAAALALYISLRIGLNRPYWAATTAYVIAQPLAGAVLSKAMFRAIGTIVGAIAAVIILPALSSAPVLQAAAFSGWLGLCVFLSGLDRTPRSYVFMLAGYSAIIIGLATVEAPGAVFTVASARVQEIMIGIICGSLVHAVVFPGSVTARLLTQVSISLRDAERWSADALAEALGAEAPAGPHVRRLDSERHRLALDIWEMHQLSTHLAYDVAAARPRVRTVLALQDRLSYIPPLAAAVEDRVHALANDGFVLPTAVEALIEDVRVWLAGLDQSDVPLALRNEQAERLRVRAAALEPVFDDRGNPMDDWDKAQLLSLLARLAELVGAHRDCRDLAEQMESSSPQPVSERAAALLEVKADRPLHKDYAAAWQGGLTAGLTLFVACLFWILSGWRDAWIGVMMAGIFLSLFSSADDPVGPLGIFFIGTLIATVMGGLFAFAILPTVSDFPVLLAVLAPYLLIGGALMAHPRHATLAAASTLGFVVSPVLLTDHYSSDFSTYINGAVAQIIGIWFAIVMARLMQSAGAAGRVRRALKAGWNDIARRAVSQRPPDISSWISRMLDRIGLMVPRVGAISDSPGAVLYQALRDMRTGLVLGELRELRFSLPPGKQRMLVPVLHAVAAHFARMEPGERDDADIALRRRIDRALQRVLSNLSGADQRKGVLALVSLRRNLFPDSAPPALEPVERMA